MGILLTNGDSFTYGDELQGSRPTRGAPIPTHQSQTWAFKLAEKLDIPLVNLAHNGSSNQKILRRTTTFLQQTSKKVDVLILIWSSWGRLEVVGDGATEADKALYIQNESMFNQIIPDHHTGKGDSKWVNPRYTLRHWGDGSISNRNFSQAAKAWYAYAYSFPTPIVHHLNYMCTMQQLADALGIKIIQGVIHWHLYHNIITTLKVCEERGEREGKEYGNLKDQIMGSLQYLRPECKLGFGDRRDPTAMALDDPDSTILSGGHPCEIAHTKYADMLFNLIQEI